MNIVVHDYSGHPGQVSLSRELANRGHQVMHQYCPSYVTGTGAVHRRTDDPEGFLAEPVALRRTFERYSMFRRFTQEVRYGRIAARAVSDHAPDVAVLSNVPLLALWIMTLILKRRAIPFVFWQQDIYSVAIRSAAIRRLGLAGKVLGRIAIVVEGQVTRRSAAVVPIDDSFVEILTDYWHVADSKIHVVPNWAPIDELPVQPRDNAWGQAHGIDSYPTLLYAGTLGLKHDPLLLSRAAKTMRDEARFVVISEGLGRELLEKERTAHDLHNLELLDFQPYSDLPAVLGSADVLIAILEPDASAYSVPSKILTYLCTHRPVVAAVPAENATARIIAEHDAGIVVPPGADDEFVAALRKLLGDEEGRERMGRRGREYAEQTFDLGQIGERFERILIAAAGRKGMA